jgi:hypothetical protein
MAVARSIQADTKTDTNKPVRKRHQTGWVGTPSAQRTRKSPPRKPRPSRRGDHGFANGGSYPVGKRITHSIADIFPPLRGY